MFKLSVWQYFSKKVTQIGLLAVEPQALRYCCPFLFPSTFPAHCSGLSGCSLAGALGLERLTEALIGALAEAAYARSFQCPSPLLDSLHCSPSSFHWLAVLLVLWDWKG